MASEETEYYWDEASQAYYYYDPECDVYRPYVEDNYHQDAEYTVNAQSTPTGAESGSNNDAEGDQQVGSDAYLMKLKSRSAENLRTVNESILSKHSLGSAELDQPEFTRSRTRRLTFKDHGGLAGCLSTAVQERSQRVDEGQLIFEMLPSKADVHVKNARELAVESRRDSGSGLQASLLKGTMVPPRDTRRRSSTTRFGTIDFINPSTQNSLALLLNSTLKPKLGAAKHTGLSSDSDSETD